MSVPIRPFEERFWKKVVKGPGCWDWTAGVNRGGYGLVRLNGSGKTGTGRRATAHRVSWMLHFGAIPDGMCVMHSCDNPPCTNPAHLLLGTQAENMADMRAKGRGRGQS